MTDREFFLARWKIEYPLFVKVLRALPEGRLDYAPHERSRSAGRIAWGMVEEVRALAQIIERGEASWESRPEPRSVAMLVREYETSAGRLNAALESVDDAKWESPGRFLAGGQVVFAGPIRDHCWWILLDGVHHRGQLSAYIRPMGGKVPAIYGPSGDETPPG